VECLDRELKRLYDVVVTHMDGTMFITADHGNAELMFDEQTLQPKTSHTMNPVPFLFIRNGVKKETLHLQGLSDIADFVMGKL
jgi:2,3-bisphosphoglycerate-independent phosphoglycerate mutase